MKISPLPSTALSRDNNQFIYFSRPKAAKSDKAQPVALSACYSPKIKYNKGFKGRHSRIRNMHSKAPNCRQSYCVKMKNLIILLKSKTKRKLKGERERQSAARFAQVFRRSREKLLRRRLRSWGHFHFVAFLSTRNQSSGFIFISAMFQVSLLRSKM